MSRCLEKKSLTTTLDLCTCNIHVMSKFIAHCNYPLKIPSITESGDGKEDDDNADGDDYNKDSEDEDDLQQMTRTVVQITFSFQRSFRRTSDYIKFTHSKIL